VLSTWKGSELAGLTYDVLVESEDPGGWQRGCGRTNNINRQIVSTRQGLAAASRSHALKLRSDCELNHDGFLSCYELDLPRASQMKLFEQRVVACQFFFRDPWKWPLLFHIGDLFHFGLRSDLLDLWDVELSGLDEGPTFLQALGLGSVLALKAWLRRFRHVEEQYVWMAFLRKKGHPVRLAHPYEVRTQRAFESELSIANNFIIVSPEQLGLVLPSRMILFPYADCFYSTADWQQLVDLYCCDRSDDRVSRRLAALRTRAQEYQWAWLLEHATRPGRSGRRLLDILAGKPKPGYVHDFEKEWNDTQ